MVEFRIDIRVDPKGAERGLTVIEKRLTIVQKRARGVESILRRAFAGFIAARAIRDIIGLADAFTLVQNKLSQVTTSTAELAVVTEELFDISQRTRSSFEETAKLYQRTALATRNLGLSQRDTLNFTEGLNQAIILSGASSSEAKNGLIQLSQGLALGTVQGRDLKSVMEQIPVVSDIIAKSLGITRGRLREFGSQGKITAEVVIKAFQEAEEELRLRFEKTISTVGQGFTVLRNNFIKFLGEVDKATGITRGLAQALVLLGQNFEEVARVVGFAAVTLGTTFATFAIGKTITALSSLSVAILTNPILLLATLIGGSIAAVVAFGDQIQWSTEGMANLQDVAKATFEIFKQVAVPALKAAQEALAAILGLADKADFLEIALRFADSIDLMMNLARGFVAFTVEVFNTDFVFGATMALLFEASLKQVEILFQQTADFVSAIFNDPIAAISRALASLVGAAIGAGRLLPGFIVSQDTVDNLDTFLSKIEANSALLQKTSGGPSAAVQKLNGELSAIIKAGEQKISDGAVEELGDAGKRAGEAFVNSFEGALARNDARRLVEEISKDAESGAAKRREAEQKRVIEQEEAREELSRKRAKNAGASKGGLTKAQQGLQRRVDPQAAFEESKRQLEELKAAGGITAERLGIAMDDIRLKSLTASTSMADGFREAFLRIKIDAQDFSNVAGGIFDSVINRTTDSLMELASSGSTSFKELANNIANDALKIITKLLIIQALNAAISGGGSIVASIASAAGGASSGVDGARANGGPVQPGRSFLVGENGPEIFKPKRAGDIVPNGEGGGQAPIVVSPNIINVRDPSEIPNEIAAGGADDAILNVLERNPERARRATGR